MWHTGAFQHLHLYMNQFDLPDLHKPPNVERNGWLSYFKQIWYFVLLSSFIVRHLNSKLYCVPSYFLTVSRIAEVLCKSWCSVALRFRLWVCCALHPQRKKTLTFDKTPWLSFKQMQASAFPLRNHSLSHWFTSHCVRKRGVSGCTVTEQWNVPARDREWALSRHPSWHKWLPVFCFHPVPPNPGLHLSIHASIFCSSPFFFLSLPPSRHPGSHAPLRGLVWPFLPPLTHTYAHLPIS